MAICSNNNPISSPLRPLRRSTFRFGSSLNNSRNNSRNSNRNPICTEEEELRRLPLPGLMRSAIKRCNNNHKISSSSSNSQR